MMMTGHGSYGYGGSSPSSSNLSALAPPFTADRSITKQGSNPLVDLSESGYAVTYGPALHNWSPNYFSMSNPEFDSLPASNAYLYSSSTAYVPPLNPSTDTILYGQSSTSLLEAKPYYPSYASSAISNDGALGVSRHSGYDLLSSSHVSTSNCSTIDDYVQTLSSQWSGLWDGFADWSQSEQVQLDRSFCSNDNFINQAIACATGSQTATGAAISALCSPERMSKYKEASHSVDTVGMEQSDIKSFHCENPKFIPIYYPATSSSISTSLVPENCPSLAPSLKVVNSWNHQTPFNASDEECFRKHDGSPVDVAKVTDSFSASVVRPHDTCSSWNINTSLVKDNKDSASSNPFFVKEPHPLISSKDNVFFDPSQLSFHLEQNNVVIADFSSEKNEEPSSNGSVSVDHFVSEKPGVQVPHKSLDDFNVLVDKNEAFHSVKNYSENLDHYNPAVDSPCWKGASGSHFSQYEVSEAGSPRNMNKLKACNSTILENDKIFAFCANNAVKISPEKRSKNSVQHDGWNLENPLTPSLKSPLDTNVQLRQEIADAVISGPHQMKPSCFHGVQLSDDAISNKSIDNSDQKPPPSDQPSYEGKWTCGENSAPEISIADVGMNRNDETDHCSSHVPFHAIEHVLHSPPSAYDSSTELSKSHGRESTGKIYVRTLIETLQKLSKLLVFHSDDAAELKEDDYEVLKDVIKNLDLCVLKNVDRNTSTQEFVIPQRAASQILGKPPKLQKDTNMNGNQVSGFDPPNCQASLKYQHILKEYNIISSKNDEKFSNFVSARVASDNMTQAIKKALIDNFIGEEETEPQVVLYKNLWLEAEASLCSGSCLARLNRVKREMENCNSQEFGCLPENIVAMEKVSGSRVSSDPCTTKTIDTEGSPSSPADDDTARFHILKYRVDSSHNLNTLDVENTLGSVELSGSAVSQNPNNVNELACEVKDGQMPDKSICDRPMLSATSHVDDVEASVLARFHILKSRVDTISSMEGEEHQRASDDLAYAGLRRHWSIAEGGSENGILDLRAEPKLQGQACESTEDKLTVKEFHLVVKDDPMSQSGLTSRLKDQSRAGFYDSSSDWEHILLEELSGQQNC